MPKVTINIPDEAIDALCASKNYDKEEGKLEFAQNMIAEFVKELAIKQIAVQAGNLALSLAADEARKTIKVTFDK